MIRIGWAVALAIAFTTLHVGLAAAKDMQTLHLELHAQLSPSTRKLQAHAILSCECSGTVRLTLGSQFVVDEMVVDAHPLAAKPAVVDAQQRWQIDLPVAPSVHRIELTYRGELVPLSPADERGVLSGLPPMASERGSFLPAGSGWYPELDEQDMSYRIEIEVPAGQRALAAGKLVTEHLDTERYRAQYEMIHPAQGIDLVAGPYVVEERSAHGVRVRTLFHPEIAQLASEYLDAAAQYIERYSALIGAYPYGDFTVVSSPLPTGFGMPSFTYLGIDVLKLPFIKSTSLGHEVLHNWWGNGVYVDWPRGNWCEGLTTFMADYAYKEQEGDAPARETRLTWLRDFAAVPRDRDRPLREFTSRTHDASQIVGYDKAAFAFLMLRDEIGGQAFASALRAFFDQQKFKRASWSDLEQAFSRSAQRDLRSFFAQWLDRTGAPAITVSDARVASAGTRFRIEARITQSEPAYTLRVPIVVETEQGSEERIVHLERGQQEVTLEIPARPKTLTIDPQLRVFRRLDPREIPSTLRQVTLDPSAVTLIASQGTDIDAAARGLAARLMDVPPRYATQRPSNASIIVIGLAADVDAALAAADLPPRPERLSNRGSAQVWTAQLADGKTLLAISARDSASLQALSRPLPHYGKQSWLVFDGSKAVERGVWETQAVSWMFQ